MVKVIVGTTTQRNEKNYTADTTIRTILEDNNVDYAVAQIMLDGTNLAVDAMDKSLADLNKTEKCMLIAVVKASNAR